MRSVNLELQLILVVGLFRKAVWLSQNMEWRSVTIAPVPLGKASSEDIKLKG